MSCGGPEGVWWPIPRDAGIRGEEAARDRGDDGPDPLDAAFEVILANRGSDTACYFHMDEDDVKYVLAHPLVMVASDTIPPARGRSAIPDQRGLPRVLGRYVREERCWAWRRRCGR